MSTLKATPSTVDAVFASAKAGDTVLLADGSYPGFGDRLWHSAGGFITVRAENRHKAVLDGVFFNGLSWVRIVDVTISGFSVILVNSHHFEMIGCYLDRPTGNDALQIIGDSYSILIEGNVFYDQVSTDASQHPDLIQLFQDFGTGNTPHDITIRKNHLYDKRGGAPIDAQGIFIKDPGPKGYRNILVEENLIACGLTNALTIQGGTENVVLRNNSVATGRIWIMSGEEYGVNNAGVACINNIAPVLLRDGTDGTVSHNLIDDIRLVLPDFLDGATVEEFRPTAEVLAAGYGALSWWAGQETPVADTIKIVAATVDDAKMGTASIVAGKVRYTPANGFTGAASGTYTVEDGAAQRATAKWGGSVSNPAPVAVNDLSAFNVPAGTPYVDIDVMANDKA